MQGQPTIIIRKRRPAHAGHHGGAWKVAYADFVTALMAFFLVMWLVNASPAVRTAVAMYFRDPGIFETTRRSGGLLPGAQSGLRNEDSATNDDLSAAKGMLTSATHGAIEEVGRKSLDRISRDLREAVASSPRFAELAEQIEIGVTPEGVRLELIETADTSFFQVGSATPKPETIALLQVLGRELAGLPNAIVIEGHTDSRPYRTGQRIYGNWELSTDRANAARRVMEASGMASSQLELVGGYADTRLRHPDAPLDARNRRISVVVRDALAPGLAAVARDSATPDW